VIAFWGLHIKPKEFAGQSKYKLVPEISCS